MTLLASNDLATSEGTVTPLDSSASHVLLYMFSVADCPSCLEELEYINDIAVTQEDIDVVGLFGYGSREEAKQLTDLYGLTFPIVLDQWGERIADLGPPNTPWKALVRKVDGMIVIEEGRGLSMTEHMGFRSRASRLR